MPNEVYVLFGTVLGAVATLFSNHFQIQAEKRKQERQEKKDAADRLREKLEHAHQLLSKIAAETSREAAPQMSREVCEARAQQNGEEMRTLQMIADLYVPPLQEAVEELARVTADFWRNWTTLIHLESQGDRGGASGVWVKVKDLSSAAENQIAVAKETLRRLARENQSLVARS